MSLYMIYDVHLNAARLPFLNVLLLNGALSLFQRKELSRGV